MASVMVVDDEDVLLEMIAALIEDIGHQAVVATNGKEALAALKNADELPLLVISDVMMPQMDGIALARAIKTDPRSCDVPIVLMSAASRPPENGVADHFIHKPFDLERIEILIEQYADRNNQRD